MPKHHIRYFGVPKFKHFNKSLYAPFEFCPAKPSIRKLKNPKSLITPTHLLDATPKYESPKAHTGFLKSWQPTFNLSNDNDEFTDFTNG